MGAGAYRGYRGSAFNVEGEIECREWDWLRRRFHKAHSSDFDGNCRLEYNAIMAWLRDILEAFRPNEY